VSFPPPFLVSFLPVCVSIRHHMKSRTFLGSLFALTALLVVLGSTGCSTPSSSSASSPQYFELRTYTTKTEAQQRLIAGIRGWKTNEMGHPVNSGHQAASLGEPDRRHLAQH